MENLDKIKKRLRKEFEDAVEVDENSDIPVSEKKVKDKKIRQV